MINWRAAQVSGALKGGKASKLVGPAEVLVRHMAGGSWRSSLSHGGQYRPPGAASRSGGGGKVKIRVCKPPVGGWAPGNLGRSFRG